MNITDDVDPDIRRFVDALNTGYASYPDFKSLDLPDRRKAAEAVRAPWRAGGPEMFRSMDISIAGIRARIHQPVDANVLPAMLYVHGGGWTMFSIDTHDRLMREYAARAGIAVIGIDYSLSPEAKFPTALGEVIDAIGELRRNAAGLGIDPHRLVVGGDSAGANLSVAAALSLRNESGPPLRGMLLNYGAYSPEHLASYARYDGPNYMLTVAEMDMFWQNYARDEHDLANPLVAPLLADLKNLPPAFLAIAECDILADSNREMAKRFEAAGVPAEVHTYRGATHSFLEAMSIAPLADRALEDAAGWLRSRLVAA